MYNTVLANLDRNAAIWEENSLILAEVELFRNVAQTISNEGFKQTEKNPKGFTQDKDAQLELMCELTYELVIKIRPYARKIKNNVLLQAVDHSISDLKKGSAEAIINRCQLIHDKGQEFLAALSAYQVTAEGLAEVKASIEKFKPMIAHRNSIGDERAAATQNLPLLFSQAREHLQSLDDLIESQVGNKDFVNSYFQSRRITSPGSSKKGSDVTEGGALPA